jgi:hypothetical protein
MAVVRLCNYRQWFTHAYLHLLVSAKSKPHVSSPVVTHCAAKHCTTQQHAKPLHVQHQVSDAFNPVRCKADASIALLLWLSWYLDDHQSREFGL